MTSPPEQPDVNPDSQHAKREAPSFSIIVPTHNRPDRLAACLAALSRLEYPKGQFDVFVVDDGSFKRPTEIIDLYQHQINVELVVQSQSGPAAARNAGANLSQREYLAFTDDDCAPQADWLTKLAQRLVENPKAAVGGHTLNVLTDNVHSTASQILIDYVYSYYNATKDNAVFLTSNNFAVSAKVFRAIGGFDTSFPRAAAEDRDFCDRWRAGGRQMIYYPDAIVLHAHAMNFRGFLKQHFNYGRGAFHYHQLRAHRRQEKMKPEPISFYLNLIAAPLRTDRRFLRLPALMFMSQAANALGCYYARFNNHRS